MLKLIGNEIYKNFKKKKIIAVAILILLVTIMGCYSTYDDLKNASPKEKLGAAEKYLDYLNKQVESTKLSESEKKTYDIKIDNQKNYINEFKKSLAMNDSNWKKILVDKITELNKKIIGLGASESEGKKEIDFEIKLDKYYINHNISPNDEYKVTSVNMIFQSISFVNLFFLPFIILIMVADVVSGEMSPPTIKMLLTKPVSRQKILLSKFVASVISVSSLMLIFQTIAFFIMGVIFKFGNLAMPKVIGYKYINDPEKLAQNLKGIRQVAGNSVISPFWQVIIVVLLMQLLYIIACTCFCLLLSVIIKKSNSSIGLGFIMLIALTIMNMNFVIANSQEAKISVFDKVIPFLFTTYGDGYMLITGILSYKAGNSLITVMGGISTLIIWSGVCYVIANFMFKRSDILV